MAMVFSPIKLNQPEIGVWLAMMVKGLAQGYSMTYIRSRCC
jgi:hypothetical protein